MGFGHLEAETLQATHDASLADDDDDDDDDDDESSLAVLSLCLMPARPQLLYVRQVLTRTCRMRDRSALKFGL